MKIKSIKAFAITNPTMGGAYSVRKENEGLLRRPPWTKDAEGNPITERVRSDLVSELHGTLDQLSKIQKKMTVQQAMELRWELNKTQREILEKFEDILYPDGHSKLQDVLFEEYVVQ